MYLPVSKLQKSFQFLIKETRTKKSTKFSHFRKINIDI